MPNTLIHLAVNFLTYYLITTLTSLELTLTGALLLASAELIDLDHLNKKPIYKKGRNSFKTHFFHKNYKLTITIAIILTFFYPLAYLGLGILSHLFLDYLETYIF